MTKSRLTFLAFLFSILALLAFSACTVTKNEGQNGKDKVDIKTPFGSLKVNENVDPRDTGLPLYAGAKAYEKGDGEHKAANVNITSEYFGLKVVAAEFTTPDPPDKVRDFYQNALKTYGKVVECKGSYVNVDRRGKGDNDKDEPVDCSDVHGNDSSEIQLKVGTRNHQRVVGLRPDGNGTRFALVYVNARGKESGS